MKKEKIKSERDKFFPYRVLYLFGAAVVMLINAGLGSFFLLDEYRVLNVTDSTMLWVLVVAGGIVIPASVVMTFLKKQGWSFSLALLSSLAISYIGFYLYKGTDAKLSTIALYQWTSLLLPLYMGIFWAIEAKYIKDHKKVVFVKTEKQAEEKASSILD